MVEKGHLVPAGSGKAEISVKRSRFIAEAVSVASPEEAREKIKGKREEFPDSTHVVYAFVTGNRASEVSGMSDDGEPPGTAGKPVMDALKGSGVYDVLITVVRYFGGTKLGTGGLVRAYSESARQAIGNMPVKEFISEEPFSLKVPYGLHEKVKLVVKGAGGRIEEEKFGDEVILSIQVPVARLKECDRELRNISSGVICLSRKRD